MSTAADTAEEKRFESGTVGGAGFGNKSARDGDEIDNSDTRFGTGHQIHPYSGATKYGSGATSGAGSGNKLQALTSQEERQEEEEETRLGLSADTHPYSHSTGYGSASTGGAGIGNKISDGFGEDDHNDSTMGKMMQKAGGIFGSKSMQEKGTAKREAAGYGEDLKDMKAKGGVAAERERATNMNNIGAKA